MKTNRGEYVALAGGLMCLVLLALDWTGNPAWSGAVQDGAPQIYGSQYALAAEPVSSEDAVSVGLLAQPEARCEHFIYGMPRPVGKDGLSEISSQSGSTLIVREIYALSNNAETKLANWVAYRLTPDELQSAAEQERDWQADPQLPARETLEPADYAGASRALGLDRGHLAPLADFAGTRYWRQANYLSNVAPQSAALNRGPWLALENCERELAREYGAVYVCCGPLYERPMPSLPSADEPHEVPSGYWKVVIVRVAAAAATERESRAGAATTGNAVTTLRAAAFVFEQYLPDTRRAELPQRQARSLAQYAVSIDEVERRSGYDLLWELPDVAERAVEAQDDCRWLLSGGT